VKQQWIDAAWELAQSPADYYLGPRKIFRGRIIDIGGWATDPVTLEDCGYTKMKLSILMSSYYHKESHDVAVEMWRQRKTQQNKMGSVCFTTYNHIIKGHSAKAFNERREGKTASKGEGGFVGSVMGPCIQAVSLTLLPKNKVGIDVYYRTTEFLKKFPADLVMLKELIAPFDMDGLRVTGVRCFFSNITIHGQYIAMLLPLTPFADWTHELSACREKDPDWHANAMKWIGRYIVPEYMPPDGEKFSQAKKVKDNILARIKGKQLQWLIAYVREHHPGIKGVRREAI
jgi:hypothetical protein